MSEQDECASVAAACCFMRRIIAAAFPCGPSWVNAWINQYKRLKNPPRRRTERE